MYKLIEIIKKNLRLLLRSKSSALIVLLGPLFLILLISMAFNTSSLYDIKIGAYSGAYSELSNSIIDKLDKDEFNILNVNSEQSIEFYVDESRMNLVYIIINSISSRVSLKSQELSTAMTSTLLNSISNADAKINEMYGKVAMLTIDLKDIKSNVDVARTNAGNLNETTNITALSDKADELNMTGEAGELIGSYRSLTNSL